MIIAAKDVEYKSQTLTVFLAKERKRKDWAKKGGNSLWISPRKTLFSHRSARVSRAINPCTNGFSEKEKNCKRE